MDSSAQNTQGMSIVVSVDDAIYAHLLLEASALFQIVANVARSCVIGVSIKMDACVGRNNMLEVLNGTRRYKFFDGKKPVWSMNDVQRHITKFVMVIQFTFRWGAMRSEMLRDVLLYIRLDAPELVGASIGA